MMLTIDSQAQFSDDGGSIVLSFSPGGSASSGLLDPTDPSSGGGPGSCHTLLNVSSISQLGENATCELPHLLRGFREADDFGWVSQRVHGCLEQGL